MHNPPVFPVNPMSAAQNIRKQAVVNGKALKKSPPTNRGANVCTYSQSQILCEIGRRLNGGITRVCRHRQSTALTPPCILTNSEWGANCKKSACKSSSCTSGSGNLTSCLLWKSESVAYWVCEEWLERYITNSQSDCNSRTHLRTTERSSRD